MPTPIRSHRVLSPRARAQAPTHVVRAGDTLSAIAQARLGDSGRWREIYALNRALIGPNPGAITPGMTLKLPQAAPPTPEEQGWSAETARAFAAFVPAHAEALRASGLEIDCADFAAKLLKDFCDRFGLKDPLAGHGAWHGYSPDRTGGLPNVKGPNLIQTGLHADNMAKQFTRRVNDADGDGRVGFDDATGAVDVHDLAPGDMLFYDWEGDGVANHTVNVLGVAADGAVTLAFGTYNNLAKGQPLTWGNLDLQPIQILTVEPGTAAYEKYLGAGNRLMGVHRHHPLPDHSYTAPPTPPPPPPKPSRWARLVAWFQAFFSPQPRA